MREVTERTEALESGVSVLVGTSEKAIVDTVGKLLNDRLEYESMAQKKNIYGDGNASKRMVDVLINAA
jgi:UDP-N-acetylglucosamine 2-epimerase (non-hydrolysing)